MGLGQGEEEWIAHCKVDRRATEESSVPILDGGRTNALNKTSGFLGDVGGHDQAVSDVGR